MRISVSARLMVPMLVLLILLLAGCSTEPTASNEAEVVSDAVQVDKKELPSWEKKLQIEVVSVYPNKSELARVYGEVKNTTKKGLANVHLVIKDDKGKVVGESVIPSIGPNESGTFDMQTSQSITVLGEPKVSLAGLAAEK